MSSPKKNSKEKEINEKSDSIKRIGSASRETKETCIQVSLDLDGDGTSEINTPSIYFSHNLTLLARHSKISLKVQAKGDLPHHIIEDTAIVLAQAFNQALGDKVGIERYGSAEIPMDEALASCAIDLSGRPYFVLDMKLTEEHVEDMATEDVIHFFETFALNAKMNLHLRVLYGNNKHHKTEAAFKAFAHSLRKAVKITSSTLLTTKGAL